ncbi:PUM-HD domain-containing protein [Aphelenchoides besseyi]|nr:PUM-HD domain-containing protein [Aphelenchoides besseyi]KAI6229468.1 PUM-HD domain-containing protein [Aphelenchoides besseyi]
MFSSITYGYEDPAYNYLCDPNYDPNNIYTVTVTPTNHSMGQVYRNIAFNNSAPSPSNNNFVTPKNNKKRMNRSMRSNNSFSPIDASDWEKSVIAEIESVKKSISFEGADSVIVNSIVDEELSINEIMDILNAASTTDLAEFFDSLKACRFLHQTYGKNEKFCVQLAKLIRNSDVEVVYKVALNPIGNFLMQDMIGVNSDMDEFICKAFIEKMQMLTMNKYGCRVVQTLIEKCEVPMVRQLVEAMLPFVSEAAINRHATHVLHCICKNHNSSVFGCVVEKLCDPIKLCIVAEDQYGCRVIQRILESLTQEITKTYVPDVFQPLVFQLLTNAERFAADKYANYLIQYFIKESAFKPQRDYIIDQIIVGNILGLSQDKFGSHVVEAALDSASPNYLHKLCEEIFHDYQILPKQRTPLEIMMFDQYGNYVVQRLLTVAIDVATGRRQGDPNWLAMLAETVSRNKMALQRYSSGKKIINTLYVAYPSFAH